MSIHVQYTVRCSGGGWLLETRPGLCHRKSTRYSNIIETRLGVADAGWLFDTSTNEHTCPHHQKED